MNKTITFKAANNREVEVDARLWTEACVRTERRGDGRLGEDDARVLFSIVAEDQGYSELEKRTIHHIRQQFAWTEEGDLTFRSLIRKAASRGWDDNVIELVDDGTHATMRPAGFRLSGTEPGDWVVTPSAEAPAGASAESGQWWTVRLPEQEELNAPEDAEKLMTALARAADRIQRRAQRTRPPRTGTDDI